METKLKIQSYGTQFNAPEGYMLNGKIVPSVASNNLTVALKTLAGTDATAANPIIIRIGDTVHSITGALSVTKNAGTNWFAAGSAELATKEIDYFVYLGYNATDGVVVGFSRIPYVTQYDQFSATTTAETFCAISTISNAAAGDDYTVVGRFAATLSAGAGYTWTVPTFTTVNLIQKPIFQTRWMDWTPAYTVSGSMTYGSITLTYMKYMFNYNKCFIVHRCTGTLGGTTSNSVYATLPFTINEAGAYATQFDCQVNQAGTSVKGLAFSSDSTKATMRAYDGANIATGSGKIFIFNGFYAI